MAPSVSPTLASRVFLRVLSIAMLTSVCGPAIAQNPAQDDLRRVRDMLLQQQREAQLLHEAQLRAGIDRVRMGELIQAETVRARALAAAGAQPAVWPDEKFEAVVFSQYGNSVEARHRLESQLTLIVDNIDRTYKLTAEQKAKLRLAGRGDIKRFFDGFETIRAKFHAGNNDVSRLEELLPEINVLQLVLSTGVLQDDSLVSKSLYHTLTAEQFERYDAARQQQQTLQHRMLVQQVVTAIERGAPFNSDRRRELIDVLTKETKPPRKPSQYDVYVVIYQVRRLPNEKLRPLFDDAQWRSLQRLVEQAPSLEVTLEQQGLIPD